MRELQEEVSKEQALYVRLMSHIGRQNLQQSLRTCLPDAKQQFEVISETRDLGLEFLKRLFLSLGV